MASLIGPTTSLVYLSERIFVLRVTPDGVLELVGHIKTEPQPLDFNIEPAGRFLIACGEKSTHVSHVWPIGSRFAAEIECPVYITISES
jgi:6-phosphogluconolactonase (cycloisomerase 2 family)